MCDERELSGRSPVVPFTGARMGRGKKVKEAAEWVAQFRSFLVRTLTIL